MEIPENIELIIFDFDGTIIDLEVDWNQLKEKLHQYAIKEYNYDCSFNPLDENLLLIKNKLGINAYSNLINMVADAEIKGIKKNKKKQEIVELIKKQHAQDKAIFSSNTRKAIESTLELLGLSPFFSCIVGKEDVSNPKPSPEGLKKILAFYGISNKDALFIGNTNADKEAGRNANVTTYLYE